MNKKNIYKQVDYLVNNVRFSDRLVLAMGSLNNVAILDNYLKCYNLSITAILDNDKSKEGILYNERKVFLPESILKPFNEKALVLIISPGYWREMKAQLEDMGYKEKKHFFILYNDTQVNNTWIRFFKEIINVRKGYKIYKDIIKRFGQDTLIVICRGATGDVYINGLFLKEYMKFKRIRNYVLVGDAKGLKRILELFEVDNKSYPLSFVEVEQLQKLMMVCNPDNLIDIFPWQHTLYVNRCRIRMTDRFNFMDTYIYYVYEGKVTREKWMLPKFQDIDENAKGQYAKAGIERDKTVIIAPFAYSINNLPVWFWDKIANELIELGYKVFANINPTIEINPFENMKSLYCTFQESVPLLEYAGYFIGLRSGFCDIISSAKCKKIILYPMPPNKPNYSVHRSDLSFSGLERMGLCTENIIEIESAVIKNITNEDVNILDNREIYQKYDELATSIMNEFTF